MFRLKTLTYNFVKTSRMENSKRVRGKHILISNSIEVYTTKLLNSTIVGYMRFMLSSLFNELCYTLMFLVEQDGTLNKRVSLSISIH